MNSPGLDLGRVERLDGVALAEPNMWVGGWYGDEKNPIQTIAVGVDTFPRFDDRVLIAKDQLEAFRSTRIGAIAGRMIRPTQQQRPAIRRQPRWQ